MIYILSWTTKKEQKNSFQTTTFKVEENSRTFQGLAQKFKALSRTSPKIQGLLKTVRALLTITRPDMTMNSTTGHVYFYMATIVKKKRIKVKRNLCY